LKRTEKEEAERWLMQAKDDLKWSKHLLRLDEKRSRTYGSLSLT